MTLSFVPTTLAEARDWSREGRVGPVPAHRVSPGYLDAFGIDASSADDLETAEFGALYLASVSCLLRGPERVVLVVDTPASWTAAEGTDAEFGLGTLTGFEWGDVTAFYLDEDAARGAVTAAATAVAGRGLADAWEDPAVVSLLAAHTLLWHGVAELGRAASH
ncbi:DUF6912 family protein [Propionicicella superfundia]|uniref:DUF6912 family protein n=1 Tax=Propionicicella superfundia TaxID=348582 RepID=UPI00042730D9|nr:hypothetical protein [Propionicicella superfundia]